MHFDLWRLQLVLSLSLSVRNKLSRFFLLMIDQLDNDFGENLNF